MDKYGVFGNYFYELPGRILTPKPGETSLEMQTIFMVYT